MYRIVICELFVNVDRIFFSIIEKFLFCQKQDIQDLRMYRMLLITFMFVSGFKNIISLLNIYHFFLSKKIILCILSSVNILIGDNDDFVGFHSTQPTNKQ